MIRIRRPVVILDVATVAVGWRPLELLVEMASSARKRGMRACQCETGELKMVELRVEPGICAMTGLASGGEAESFVVGIDCLLKLRGMAGNAGSG